MSDTQAQKRQIEFEDARIALVKTRDVFGKESMAIFVAPNTYGEGTKSVIMGRIDGSFVNAGAFVEDARAFADAAQDAVKMVEHGGLVTHVERILLKRLKGIAEEGRERLNQILASNEADEQTMQETKDIIAQCEVVAACENTVDAERELREVYRLNNEYGKALELRIRRQVAQGFLEAALESVGPDATEDQKRAIYDACGLPYPEPVVPEPLDWSGGAPVDAPVPCSFENEGGCPASE